MHPRDIDGASVEEHNECQHKKYPQKYRKEVVSCINMPLFLAYFKQSLPLRINNWQGIGVITYLILLTQLREAVKVFVQVIIVYKIAPSDGDYCHQQYLFVWQVDGLLHNFLLPVLSGGKVITIFLQQVFGKYGKGIIVPIREYGAAYIIGFVQKKAKSLLGKL